MLSVIVRNWKRILVFFSVFIPVTLLAAPDYTFTSAVLESGTDLQVGAVYRFTAVKPGVDALVTITFITAGCSVTQIDNDGAGYAAAFQPEVLVPKKMIGYAEFNITFVATTTSTPMIMAEIPASAIDIDGNNALAGGPMNEYDEISMAASSYVDYDLLGGQLSVSTSAGWMKATNTGGTEYSGISISATAVMVTTVNAGVSFFNYRTGINNQSNINNLPRQKSLYFQKMTFPNSILAANDVRLFTGTAQKAGTALSWQLGDNPGLQSVALERSADGMNFITLQVFSVEEYTGNVNWLDTIASPDAFYRLRLNYSNTVAYSRILSVKNRPQENKLVVDIYPSLIRSTATVSFSGIQSGPAVFYVINAQGKVMVAKSLQASPGKNIFSFTPGSSLPAGLYVAGVFANGRMCSKEIILQ